MFSEIRIKYLWEIVSISCVYYKYYIECKIVIVVIVNLFYLFYVFFFDNFVKIDMFKILF